MRAARSSLLVAVATLVAACSSTSAGRVDLAMTEPPPVSAPADLAPAVAEPVVAAPTPLAVPEAVAVLPAPAPDEAPVAADDDPIPLGAAPRLAAAPAGAPAGGGVRAAGARPARKAQPTGRIEIPAIGLNHLTYEGIDLPTIDNGPSHWPGTPLPGQLGNTVFPGHRTTYSRPFWDMDKLVPGDEVIFSNSAGRFTYRVQRVFIVNANETWVVNNTPDATFTLLACHPKGSAKQRIVAKGAMVNQPKPPPPPQGAPTPTSKPKFLGIL